MRIVIGSSFVYPIFTTLIYLINLFYIVNNYNILTIEEFKLAKGILTVTMEDLSFIGYIGWGAFFLSYIFSLKEEGISLINSFIIAVIPSLLFYSIVFIIKQYLI